MKQTTDEQLATAYDVAFDEAVRDGQDGRNANAAMPHKAGLRAVYELAREE